MLPLIQRSPRLGQLPPWLALGWSLLLCSVLLPDAEAQQYRSFDGSGNNLTNSTWGSAGTNLGRITPISYSDNIGSVSNTMPNVRELSNSLFSQSASTPDPRRLSEWAWLWGQFIDHDIDHTLTSAAAGTLQVPIPANDPVFGVLPPGSSLPVTRALVTTGTGVAGTPDIPREHPNNISAWLDGNMIYGGRAVDGPSGVDRTAWLRDPLDPAKLRTSDGGALGDLLPKYQHGTSPVMANTNTPGMTQTTEGDLAYVAGDVRANENTSLLMLQTVFVREHNRLVDVLRGTSANFTPQELYDRARKIVGAEIQAITYREFLPAMGVQLDNYQGYDANVNPTVSTEFSNAAFRIAHSQINAEQLRLNSDGSLIAAGRLNLAQSFFNPTKLTEGGLEPLIRGLASQVQEANDLQMVNELRNQLFSIFIPNFGLVNTGTDLAALDILRGRDVGIGSFNQVRIELGLAPYASFSEITPDATTANTLAALYGDIDNIDLFVGLLAEPAEPGSSLGETTLAIYDEQFSALRDGDRFWFEHDLSGINSDLLYLANWDGNGRKAASTWLESLTLSQLLRLNTDVGVLQANVFFVPVPEPHSLFAMTVGVLTLSVFRRHLR